MYEFKLSYGFHIGYGQFVFNPQEIARFEEPLSPDI